MRSRILASVVAAIAVAAGAPSAAAAAPLELFQPPVFGVANFGYQAGDWRVEQHPRLLGDVNGDGRADIVGFGNHGAYVSQSNQDGTFGEPVLAVANFGYQAGDWRVERHPRLLGDVNGDGRADIVGFGNHGTYVSQSNDNGTFGEPVLAVANFGYQAGDWRVEQHPRLLGDVNGDGRADIVGFGNHGTYVSQGNQDGTFGEPVLAVANFGYQAGDWRVERHPRLLGDVNGDGRADIVGFHDVGTYVSLGTPDGTFTTATLPLIGFGYHAGGWRVEKHPRLLADVNGDAQADIVGFHDLGTYVSIRQADGTYQTPALTLINFGYEAGGWRIEKHPRFVTDVNGDTWPDIVGFGNHGTYVSRGNGDGSFMPPELGAQGFGYDAGGWRVDRHPRLLADVNGDARADIIGFADTGVQVALAAD